MLNSDKENFDKLFKEMNKKLFVFAKSFFVGIWNEPDLTETANDVVQETWSEFLKGYTHKLNNPDECKMLLYRIARNAALRQKKNNQREVSITLTGDKSLPEKKVESTVFATFAEEKMKKIFEKMSQKHPNYVFILQAFMNAGNDMKQEDIVREIALEYEQLFKTVLTVGNFTKILQRAREKFFNLWNKYQ